MSESQVQPVREYSSAAPQLQKRPPYRILVVDDDESLRQLNAEVLSKSGYEVDAAEDGAEAWEVLQLNSYDLLITDQQMPKLSGVELLKKLRAARLELPVILATGTLPQTEFILHPWLQFTAVLLKPYTIPELLGMVRDVLYAVECPREQSDKLLTGHNQSAPIRLRP